MNIEEYYKQSAMVSLNASLVAFVPSLFFIIYGILVAPSYKLSIFIYPFLIYSLIAYQIYLLNMNRSKKVKKVSLRNLKTNDVLEENNLLITFLPAPSLRMLLFEPNGNVVGEIRDIKFWGIRWYLPYFIDRFFAKSYGFYNDKNKLLFQFRIKKRGIEILTPKVDFDYMEQIKSIKNSIELYKCRETKIKLKKNLLYTDYRFFNEKEMEIAQLKKGWMPKEWGERFLDPNTPILSFNKCVEEKDRIRLFGLIVKQYVYRDH